MDTENHEPFWSEIRFIEEEAFKETAKIGNGWSLLEIFSTTSLEFPNN